MKNIAVVSLKYPPIYSGYGNQAKMVLDEISNNYNEFNFIILTGKFPKSKKKANCIQ
ncbi:hypothetical protein [Sinobaca sp. H24]|uniref:hypothetical protein n=1 Tax=Sinobaca sp. H24 TaxID=2923376 RepID=UPI002079C321|nr:hypothetical protein [Sinobaca sp. H24]